MSWHERSEAVEELSTSRSRQSWSFCWRVVEDLVQVSKALPNRSEMGISDVPKSTRFGRPETPKSSQNWSKMRFGASTCNIKFGLPLPRRSQGASGPSRDRLGTPWERPGPPQEHPNSRPEPSRSDIEASKHASEAFSVAPGSRCLAGHPNRSIFHRFLVDFRFQNRAKNRSKSSMQPTSCVFRRFSNSQPDVSSTG